MSEITKSLWEILVPYNNNKGQVYFIAHHKEWDKKIINIAGGITIFKISKGQWVNENNENFHDKMIPVRIYCTEKQIDEIIQITMEHYDQEAILCYKISNQVKLIKKSDLQEVK